MPGNVSVDTQKLQNIKTALQQFNTSMQSNSAGIISYLAEKKSEVESNLRKRLKQFEVNESYRRQAEYNADDDSRADVLAENSRQRQRETEELNDLKSLIRAFGSVSSELEHHLKAMAGTHSETVAKGASTLEKSIQILEEYFAITLPSSSNGATEQGKAKKISNNSPTSPPASQMRAYANNWVSNLSDRQKDAIHDYTKEVPPYYKNINGVLRGHKSNYDAGNEERSELIHQALSSARTPCDITVYRGCSNDVLGDLAFAPDEALTDGVFVDRGYASTSMSRGLAFGGDMLLEIHLPAGAQAANIESLSAAGRYEEEVLIDRGQMFHIVGAHRNGNGRRIVEVNAII